MTTVHHLYIVLSGFRDRLQKEERGATAVEWVIITGILILLAGGVGLAITSAVNGKADDIKIP